MTEKMKEHYSVEVVFRGLCLNVLKMNDKGRETGMMSALVDARKHMLASNRLEMIENGQCVLRGGEVFREHYGVLEFFYEDWIDAPRHPSDLPDRFNRVAKRSKERDVGLHFLEHEDVRFGVEDGTLGEEFKVIHGGPNGFERIPQLSKLGCDPGKPKPQLGDIWNPPQELLARVFVDKGVVETERIAEAKDPNGNWVHAKWGFASLDNSLNPVNGEVEINLDTKVTFKVPQGQSFVVEMYTPSTNDPPRKYRLRPTDESQGLRLWIKNREIDLVLSESDRLDDRGDCEGDNPRDVDLQLLYRLMTKDPANAFGKTLHHFRYDGGPVSGGGCMCGNCGG